MAKLLRLFRTPTPKSRPAIGRSLRGLSVGDRLDLSLRAKYYRPEIYAWGW
jgi:hypothetical protein